MNTARQLLATLRRGDYAHAGEEEAIDILIKRALVLSPDIQKGNCLDVGSGSGGTANYIYNLKFPSLFGIDLDENAVAYAKKAYPWISFVATDANNISKFFDKEFFSFIYMFNVLYAIEDKQAMLKELNKVAKSGALLAIFDYTKNENTFDLNDLAGKPMHPLILKSLQEDLTLSGWELLEFVDLSEDFKRWYKILLSKIEIEKMVLPCKFSAEDLAKVETTFNILYEKLKSRELGGGVVFARKYG